MKPPNSAELLRNLVKAAVVDRGQRRALMRAMGLKSQGTITQWLNGEHNPSVDKLDSIAKFLGCQVPDLFRPVQESEGVTSPGQPTDLNSASHTGIGGTHGTDAQASDIESTSMEIRKALRKIASLATAALGDDDAGRSVERTRVPKAGPRRRIDSRSA